jgi:hypothetical protein
MADTYIEFFTGSLGGGKTYNATIRMLNHLATGGHVYTNVELKKDGIELYLRTVYGVQVELDEQIHFLTHEQMQHFPRFIAKGSEIPVLVVADEAHLLWNNLEWASVGKEVLTFITLARKCRVHIVLITQHPNNVAKQFRTLAQFFWSFRDIRKLRIPLLRLSLAFLPIIHAVCIDAYSKQPIRKDTIPLDQRIFACYNTAQLVLPLELSVQAAGKVKKLSWDECFPVLSRRFYGLRRVEWAGSVQTFAHI